VLYNEQHCIFAACLASHPAALIQARVAIDVLMNGRKRDELLAYHARQVRSEHPATACDIWPPRNPIRRRRRLDATSTRPMRIWSHSTCTHSGPILELRECRLTTHARASVSHCLHASWRCVRSQYHLHSPSSRIASHRTLLAWAGSPFAPSRHNLVCAPAADTTYTSHSLHLTHAACFCPRS
jgi:hypothetical protein